MTKGILKWLASLGTGAATTLLAYLAANVGDPANPIADVDPLIMFIVVTLVTKGVTYLTSLLGPKPTTSPAP